MLTFLFSLEWTENDSFFSIASMTRTNIATTTASDVKLEINHFSDSLVCCCKFDVRVAVIRLSACFCDWCIYCLIHEIISGATERTECYSFGLCQRQQQHKLSYQCEWSDFDFAAVYAFRMTCNTLQYTKSVICCTGSIGIPSFILINFRRIESYFVSTSPDFSNCVHDVNSIPEIISIMFALWITHLHKILE